MLYQIKVTIKGSKPPIWRRVLVPGSISLHTLHTILQILFGWDDYHLHQFTIADKAYGVPDPEEDSFWGIKVIEEETVMLADVLPKEGQQGDYWYDFGDNWHHDILVEKIQSSQDELKYPQCIAGKRSAPPEDVGGVWGYEDFLEIIKDPKHEEHEERLEWVGGDFDPKSFDLETINKELMQKKLKSMSKKVNGEQLHLHFTYPIIQELYRHDLLIDRSILREIIGLGDAIIPDLELVLADIIEHDEIYREQDDFNWYTLSHTIHLLGELQAEQSLPKILEVFRQDEDFLEFWFSDSLNEELWEVIYKCSQHSLETIETFLKDQSVWVYSRAAVSEGLLQIALHLPDKRIIMISLYQRVIDATKPFVQYKEQSRGKLLHDTKDDEAKVAIAFYVSNLIDLNEPELKEYLLTLFKEGVVETSHVGPQDIREGTPVVAAKEIKSIYERYDELEHIYSNSGEQKQSSSSVIMEVQPKIGRNDPCGCGSGKKYKKCHYLKV